MNGRPGKPVAGLGPNFGCRKIRATLPELPETVRTGDSSSAVRRWGIEQPRRYALLAMLGVVDNGTRGAALAFLPFVLAGKGLDPAAVSWLFTVVFVGGAFGKFGCGRLGDRFGATALIVTTELVTVGALALFPAAPVLVVPLLAACFGFVLNGTSRCCTRRWPTWYRRTAARAGTACTTLWSTARAPWRPSCTACSAT